tara:strand:+ start:745 stop:984 length:240 start_codon:yes stop_codon:yes gene_type:complete
MSEELLKTIEAQGRLLTELRAELDNIKKLSKVLVDYNYDDESKHYDESTELGDYDSNFACATPDDHIFNTIKKLNKLTQ